ncbi:hypothetical protein C8R45DRAFT_927865 [Mycena sanguinolenta]|nr:hypothetical protein C8R45DRAFT_927865 [Mycena sanguinolenta]
MRKRARRDADPSETLLPDRHTIGNMGRLVGCLMILSFELNLNQRLVLRCIRFHQEKKHNSHIFLHQEKPPLETYLQFGKISFLRGKTGQLEEIRDNIRRIATVGKVTLLGVPYTKAWPLGNQFSGPIPPAPLLVPPFDQRIMLAHGDESASGVWHAPAWRHQLQL